MKKKHIGNKIVTAVFLVFLFGMSLGSILAKDREFSQVENRVLSGKPEFTWESLFDGTYGSSLEKYASDQLILKDSMVMLKNQTLRSLGRTRIGNVYLGKGNRYIQEYTQDKETLSENISYIKGWCEKSGLGKEHTFFLLAPNASQIYGESLPYANLNQSQEESIEAVQNGLKDSATLVNPLKTLENNKKSNLYYKTDHHWTMYGAYLAYEELAGAMNISPVSLDSMKKTEVSRPFLGSLYSQAPLFFAEEDHMALYDYENLEYTVSQVNFKTGDVIAQSASYIREEQLKEKDKYAALFGGNYAYLEIKNSVPDENAEGKKLLIFKDSYANSLIPYLIAAYEEIHIIDLRYFDYIGNSVAALGKDGGYNDVLFLYNVSFLNSDKNFMGLE